MAPREVYCWAELDTRTIDWMREAAAHDLITHVGPAGPDGHIHLVPAIVGDPHLLSGACECEPRARRASDGRTRIIHRSPIQRLKVPARLPAKL